MSATAKLLPLWAPSVCRFAHHVHPVAQHSWIPAMQYCSSTIPTRMNPIDIQMLYKPLHDQIFKQEPTYPTEDVERSVHHLKTHDLWGKETSALPEVDFKLPDLLGSNIDEHFKEIAKQQSKPYLDAAQVIANSRLPTMPREWRWSRGWTKYDATGHVTTVDYPDEEAIVFDVEVCMSEGDFPTLATAASPNAWYSWVSDRLLEDHYSWSPHPTLDDLITMETAVRSIKPGGEDWREKIVIGHNVSFDRSYIKEQYFMKGPKTRFLDTMSLHMAISGLTSFQRILWLASRAGKKQGLKDVREYTSKTRKQFKGQGIGGWDWLNVSSINNLGDVHVLYTGGPKLEKSERDVFVKGTLQDVRNQFQELMTYCARDVRATHEIFSMQLPMFLERFPHAVTLAGMLEMGQCYLPVNSNWERYLRDAEDTFQELQKEMKLSLMHLANDACQLMHNDRYQEDPWLWELDWSTQELTLKKETSAKKKKIKVEKTDEGEDQRVKPERKSTKKKKKKGKKEEAEEAEDQEETEEDRIQRVLETADRLPKIKRHMPGYPAWYRDLCPKVTGAWSPGPNLISAQARVTPKLLRLRWDGFPLHYEASQGWGYLVPGRTDNMNGTDKQDGERNFPTKAVLDAYKEYLKQRRDTRDKEPLDQRYSGWANDDMWDHIMDLSQKAKGEGNGEMEEAPIYDSSVLYSNGESAPEFHRGAGPYNDVDLPGVWFFRLPHKDGAKFKVGNPLAKDYLNKMEDGTLTAAAGGPANRTLEVNKMVSFWRNARDRVMSQMVVWLKKKELPRIVSRNPDYEEEGSYGAIIPRVVTAGTVTRRAVEPTWLTASNARPDRVGSELKAIVQAPPGYHFIGADVDSQELWIAAILGDANFAGFHGCTSFGWMTLQGKKSSGTDLHSKTASTIGISRDHAKVFNYGRIYGAGQPFAERLLLQFNHRMTQEEAGEKAKQMYAATKGVREYKLTEAAQQALSELGGVTQSGTEWVSLAEVRSLSRTVKKKLFLGSVNISGQLDIIAGRRWVGGTESEMFNKLESIANSAEPRTPVLDCRISRALEPAYVKGEFVTSRVNWVVQSSAVDYLHLMLVCMRWLFDKYNIDGRFCISIHDEVRYLVQSEDRYRAALALQITNLLTRSMFAYRLGMNDLPQSVAFFSAVDVDTVMRKEVNMDCKTPSNPHGLTRGYGIPPGDALDIYQILEKTNSSLRKEDQQKEKKPNKRVSVGQ
ncbi:DNA polymerase subunit gamma-1-like isoform X1 [Branchiostoma floridae]|uniref:DNA polymerase subunit gamma-1 n=1 Tax=Branchiostoma floridae TaxID=7739 RepID=A0A9J7KQJ2_BRAFL|nr:DNA polymerase subunit gamma-1-like isoform X1 [Branchiostoma floridae]